MKRPVIFYGWYVVVAGLLLMAYNDFAMIYGFTAFVNPIAATFGWSYTQISLAMSLRGIETGVLNPLVGTIADRFPARRLVLVGIIIYGLGILCISQASNLFMFYIGFLIIGLGNSLAVFLVPATTVARWFRKNIGKASGILAMGGGIGGALVPLLVKIIDTQGWQTTLLFLAGGAWAVGIPLSFVFRNRPEDYGLLPDGKPQDDLKSSSSVGEYIPSSGILKAFKTRAFWNLGIASTFQIVGMSALNVHIMPYLTSLGVDRGSASIVAMLIPLSSLASRIPFGLLADVFRKKYMIASSICLMSAGLFLIWLTDGSSFGLIILSAVIFGLGLGGFIPLRMPFLREYFGTKNFGAIFGFTSLFTTIGLISGPPVAGWVFDTYGVYGPIWLIFSGIAIVGAILMLTTPPAIRKPESNVL